MLVARVLLAVSAGRWQDAEDAARVRHAWNPSGSDGFADELRAVWEFSQGRWDAEELAVGRESWEVFAWVPLAERVLEGALNAAGRR